MRSVQLGLIAACLLPSLAFAPAGAGRGAPPLVASFIPACESIPPRIEFFPSDAMLPRPRPRGAPVEVYLAGRNPTRRYTVLGEVQVRARNRRTGFRDLLDHAEREARRRGADALIEVTADPPLGQVIREPMRLNAKIVMWG